MCSGPRPSWSEMEPILTGPSVSHDTIYRSVFSEKGLRVTRHTNRKENALLGARDSEWVRCRPKPKANTAAATNRRQKRDRGGVSMLRWLVPYFCKKSNTA